jgi:enoyl-CoA hydratase/carnithine racemase
MPTLERRGEVFILDLGPDENRFNPDWLTSVEECLDEVEHSPAPRALVTTATGKFWSNGLDLVWMSANVGEVTPFIARVHALFARVLGMGCPTVAAIQGHAFAAAAMLALAHDQRVMRADRGYFCLPEVDINIPFTPGMSALIQARLPVRVAHEAMTTGRRYGGNDAEKAGIVDYAVEEDRVVPRAVELAAGLAAKDPGTLATIKERMYKQVLDTLLDAGANEMATPSQRSLELGG